MSPPSTVISSSAVIIPFEPQPTAESFVQATEAWLDRWHEDRRLTQSNKNLCTRVCRYFNRARFERTGELLAWPSWVTLMTKTGLSRSSVARGLKKLEKLGALKIQHGGRDAKTGWKLGNQYLATPQKPGVILQPGQVSFSTKTRCQDETRLSEDRLVEKEYSEPSAPPSAESVSESEKEKGLPRGPTAPEEKKEDRKEEKPDSPSEGPSLLLNNPLPPFSAPPPSPRWVREAEEAEAILERYRARANGGGQ
jgi:hypothetical protein